MAALTRSRLAFPAALMLLAFVAFIPALAQEAPAESAPELAAAPAIPGDGVDSQATAPWLADLDAAEAAYLSADFDRATELAGQLVVMLEAEPPGAERDAALARALGIGVQAEFSLGRTDGIEQTIDRMLAALPTYALDPAIAGSKLADRVESRRRAIVGRLDVTCRPFACEEVLVDGRPVPRDATGLFVVLAGAHELTLRRHGFDEHVVTGVEVRPNETLDLLAELVQVARDLRVATDPGGVEVWIDGALSGVTPQSDDRETRALEILELAPGPHVIELRKPCFRRLEQKVEIVLDALDPGPLALGTITLSPARGIVDIAWDRPQGRVMLDGSPAGPGRHELCPGAHEATVSLGGRRVWFERFDLAEDQLVEFAPVARPTIAIVGADDEASRAVRDAVSDQWNVLEVATTSNAAARAFAALLEASLEADVPPLRPARRLEESPEFADEARRLAPEADLLMTRVRLEEGVRAVNALVLVDPKERLVETSAWPEGDSAATSDIAVVLLPELPLAVPYAGFDLADRRAGGPVIAHVDPGGPAAAAELLPGDVVLAVAGTSVSSASEIEATLATFDAPGSLVLRVSSGEGARDVTLEVVSSLAVTTPAAWRDRFLLPTLARARVERSGGTGAGRLMGSLVSGMLLASLGRDESAALALDGAGVNAELDPSGDARGTVYLVLERLFRALGDDEYAAEVRARRGALDAGRFGGRTGPDLRHAPGSAAP